MKTRSTARRDKARVQHLLTALIESGSITLDVLSNAEENVRQINNLREELTLRESRIAVLTEERNALDASLDASKSEFYAICEKKDSAYEDLRKKYAAKEEEFKNATSLVNELRNSCRDLSCINRNLDEENNKINEEMNLLRLRSVNQDVAISETKKVIAELQAEKEKLSDDFRVVNRSLAERKEKEKHHAEESKNMKAALDKKTSELASSVMACEAMGKTNDLLNARIFELEQHVQQLNFHVHYITNGAAGGHFC